MLNNQTQSYFSQSNLWSEKLASYQEQVLADILAILPSDISSILDVGCGNGLITNQLPDHLKVVGLDRSEEALKYVRREKILGDILNIPLDNESFDLVICNDVLEHLTNEEREQSLKELARVARKYILITVPFLEDLNQGMTKCADCGKYYHINHHLQSFDLETTRQFFNNFNYKCIRQVLSGDIWYGEPPEIVLTRRILSDLPHTENPVCLHCGSQKTIPSQDSNDVVAPLIAKLCLNNPSLLDWHSRRTECISLFDKSNKINNIDLDNLTKCFIDQNNHEVYLTSELVNTNEIFFNKKSLYYHTFLPKISRLPYYCVNTLSLDQRGIILTAGQNLLLGFFCESNEDKINLTFSGFAQEESTIVITKYDDLQSYILPVTKQINNEFMISLEFPFSLSTYGFLVQISVLKGNISLTDARLTNITFDQVRVYDNQEKKARFWRTIGVQQNIIDISLPIYGESIIAQGWENQINIVKTNPIINYSILEKQPNTDLCYLSILSQEIRAKNQVNINMQNQQQQLKSEMQQLQNQIEEDQKLQAEMQQNQEQQLQAKIQQNQRLQTEIQQLPHQNQQLQNILENLSLEIKQKNHVINQLQTKYEQTLLRRIKRKILSFGIGQHLSFEDCKQQILNSIKPNIIDTKWDELRANDKLFLMICHDQNIDRRIFQQATALIEDGWQGKIICLSFDNEDNLEEQEGISIHRIGLAKIVSDCPVYWRYQNRQRLISWWGRNFNVLSKINWLLYKIDLFLTYRSRAYVGYPLSFDNVFYETSKHYQSDIIIAHDLPALKTAAILSEKWNIPLVYDAHELYSEQKAFSSKQRKLLDDREKEYAKNCTKIITVSPSFAKVIAHKNNVTFPEVILNVTQRNSAINQQDHFFNKLLNLPNEHKIILYQGGVSHNRNLEVLVRGFIQVKQDDVHLVFLGPTEPKLEKSLKKIAGNLLDNNIHFIPPVSQAELLRYTTSADFGVIPYPPCDMNTKFCMPNKMFEYIQASLPILANDLVEVGRIFNQIGGGGMITDLNTPTKVKEGINSMLKRNLQEDRKKLSEAREQFSWSTEKVKYIKIINDVMSEATKCK
jgi:glycosyltransferase involved in cell wall biosynthesis/ubiquinone/menaquinone biosynthesis C-methylase UbiE